MAGGMEREKRFFYFSVFIIRCLFCFACSYFQDGLKTIEHFGSYITDLSQGLQRIRQKQDEERKQLADLRQLLKSSHVFDKEVSLRQPTTTTTTTHGRASSMRFWAREASVVNCRDRQCHTVPRKPEGFHFNCSVGWWGEETMKMQTRRTACPIYLDFAS